jgi:RNA 2',3'-cyclic 3'-phosphodiesterase
MLRLFTGLEIPSDIAFDLAMMKGGLSGARWIERDSYHLTLRFIGDVEEGLARDLAEALDGVAVPSFVTRLKGLGAFGGAKPHVLYVAMEASPELKRLQAAHERVCQQVGLVSESRKFTPHVTLARLRRTDSGEVQRYIAAHNLYESRPFEVDRFVLFRRGRRAAAGPMPWRRNIRSASAMPSRLCRAVGGR